MKSDSSENNMKSENKPGGKYRLSVVVPNRNGVETIGRCLDALFASKHDSFEVVVVDDCSNDNSVNIIKKFPCKLIELTSHAGAATARNRGARNSQGDIIFFTDADCLVLPDTLKISEKAARRYGPNVVVGGSYTCKPFDDRFFSLFQSIFINYSELKRIDDPDYIATHAMVIHASAFRDSGGFREEFLPILEDVEFSHRLRKEGYQLQMVDRLLVRHIFNYSLEKSLRNAYAKTKSWVMYSLANRDLFSDSGTASIELKTNVLHFHLLTLSFLAWLKYPEAIPPVILGVLLFINFLMSHRLLNLFFKTGGPVFAFLATTYYMLAYPIAVGAGALAALLGKREFHD